MRSDVVQQPDTTNAGDELEWYETAGSASGLPERSSCAVRQKGHDRESRLRVSSENDLTLLC
jgi:hypothetical protein